MKKTTKILGATFAVAAALTTAPTAHAIMFYATTTVEWGGTPCIAVRSANSYDHGVLTVDTICSGSGTWSWSESSTGGGFVGGDPNIGDASWLSCTVWVDGRVVDHDYVTRNDGRDANCLVKLPFTH